MAINSEVLNSSKPWDRLRVVCKQPHRNDVLFGLSLLKIRGQRLDNPQIFHQPNFENILPASGNQDKELPKNSKSDHRWKIRRNVCYRNLKLEKNCNFKSIKTLFCYFKNGKKSIYAPEKSPKMVFLVVLNFFLVQK